MLNFIALAKYHATIMAVVTFIEAAVPDDLPGTKKLDMALKILIEKDAKLAGMAPDLSKLIGLAKSVYNRAREATADPAA